MSSPHRRSTLLMLICAGGWGASCAGRITVPSPNPQTRPDVVLDVHFPQAPILTVTPTASIPEVPPHLVGNEELTLVASCTDNVTGCRNIEIFAEATTTNTNGSVVAAVPGPAVVESLDTSAAPGGTASPKRSASIKLSVPQLRGTAAGLKLNVSARATNAYDEQWNTRTVSLHWSHQPPLELPDCPRFFGSVRAKVLDSRLVTMAIQDAKAANPARTTFVIFIVEPPPPNTLYKLRLDIEDAPIAPTSAIFKLVDDTGWNRELLTVNSGNCNATGTTLSASANSSSGELTVDSGTTTTIVIRAPNTGLGAFGFRDIAVWSEPNFWLAFGGKKTTITWVHF